MQIPEFIVTIIVALVSAGGFWALIERGLVKSRSARSKALNELIKEVKEIKEERTLLDRQYIRILNSSMIEVLNLLRMLLQFCPQTLCCL